MQMSRRYHNVDHIMPRAALARSYASQPAVVAANIPGNPAHAAYGLISCRYWNLILPQYVQCFRSRT